MKRILGIVASPRKLGNSELLTKAAMKAAGPDNHLEMIRLTELDIKECKACYSCLPPEVPCHIKDDFNFLLGKIQAADAVVLAAPCYFLGPQGSIKMLQDRFLSVSNNYKEFAGKPCITFTTYGVPGSEGYAEAALNLTARFINLSLIDSAVFLSANPAEVLENPANLKKAQKMGRGLLDPNYQRASKDNECPVCWSDIFRFAGTNLTCPFCGTQGVITMEGQAPKFIFAHEGSHRFREDARKEHFEVFLEKKKKEFINSRNYYRKLQAPYQDQNWWVRPPANNDPGD